MLRARPGSVLAQALTCGQLARCLGYPLPMTAAVPRLFLTWHIIASAATRRHALERLYARITLERGNPSLWGSFRLIRLLASTIFCDVNIIAYGSTRLATFWFFIYKKACIS